MNGTLKMLLGLAFFGGCGLYLLYGIIKRPPAIVARFEKEGKDIGSPLYKIVAFVSLAFAAACVWGLIYIANDPKDIKNVKDEASAKAFVVGTWTYTKPLSSWSTNYLEGWEKYVFKADGTFDYYSAMPNANDWGKPINENKPYKLVQRKFKDTGEKYWAIDVGWFIDPIIWNDGTIRRSVMDGNTLIENRFFERGDVNPFK